MRKRKRLEQHTVYYGENRGVRSDAKGEGENGDDAEAGTLAQHAQAVTRVLQKVLKPVPAPRLATFFPQTQRVSNFPLRRILRFLRRFSRLDQFSLLHFAVQTQLFVHLAIEVFPAQKDPHAPADLAKPLDDETHGALLMALQPFVRSLPEPARIAILRLRVAFVPRSQLVATSEPILLGRSSPHRDPPLYQHPLQCRLEGALLHLQRTARNPLDCMGDFIAVQFAAAREGFQNQHVERSGWNLV